MRKRTAAFALLMLTLPVVAGCGGDDASQNLVIQFTMPAATDHIRVTSVAVTYVADGKSGTANFPAHVRVCARGPGDPENEDCAA